MTPSLYWIEGPWPGRLAISARPRGGDWIEDEVGGWRAAGVQTVVSLLEPDEESQLEIGREGPIVRQNGMRFSSFPIVDRGVPDALPAAVQFLSDLKRALESGEVVAVHCRQGIGRSALVATGLLVLAGLPVQEALQRVSAARGLPVPETSEQHDWISKLAREHEFAPR